MSEVNDFPLGGKEKLVSDMKIVISDAEEILRETGDVAGEKIHALRERIACRLIDAKARIDNAEEILLNRTREAARVADDYVNENPWQAIGVAAGVGFLLGALICRR